MENFFTSLDLVKVTLFNGNDRQDCDGTKITVHIYGKSQEGSTQRCYSKEKTILASSTTIWNKEDLRDSCKKFLFDLDKEIEVQVQTAAQDPFCPKNVELEIFDNSNKPRYFCSKMKNQSGGYTTDSNWRRHVAKEERCPSS